MIRLMEMVKYRHIRPFTKVEMNHITDEYLNNNKYEEVMPDFAKDKDDLLSKFELFEPLHVGEYMQGIRSDEGNRHHFTFCGIKR